MADTSTCDCKPGCADCPIDCPDCDGQCECADVKRADSVISGVTRFDMPIIRADEERREVWGWASSSAVATDGKIIRHAANKKAFANWISRGNVREMHQLNAVGKAIAWEADDANERIMLGTRISRGAPTTWEKVLDQTLSAYSVKGNTKEHVELIDGQVRRVVDELVITEVSLVDAGADPSSHFTEIIRADVLDDGPLQIPTTLDADIDRAEHGGYATHSHLHEHPNPNAAGTIVHEHEHTHPANSMETGSHNHAHGPAVEDHAMVGEAGLMRVANDPNVGGGVDRDKLPESDFAGPDRTYPIVTAADVSDAADLIGKAANPEAVKMRIIEIAKRKGFESAIPKAWAEDSVKRADGSGAPHGDVNGPHTHEHMHDGKEHSHEHSHDGDAAHADHEHNDAERASLEGTDVQRADAATEGQDVDLGQQALTLVGQLLQREVAETIDPDDDNDGMHVGLLMSIRSQLVQFVNGEEVEAMMAGTEPLTRAIVAEAKTLGLLNQDDAVGGEILRAAGASTEGLMAKIEAQTEIIAALSTQLTEIKEQQETLSRAADPVIVRVDDLTSKVDELLAMEQTGNRPATRIFPVEKAFGLEDGKTITRADAMAGLDAAIEAAKSPEAIEVLKAERMRLSLSQVYADGPQPQFRNP